MKITITATNLTALVVTALAAIITLGFVVMIVKYLYS